MERFEEKRSHLRAAAYRMLASLSEADDAIQEAWLRFSGSGAGGVENLSGWLTAVVARVCLDMLRSRKARREEPLGEPMAEPVVGREDGHDPEHQAVMADSVGLALLVVLETLAPAERVAFVLHDMFDLPFDLIPPIVGRSPTAARQLASRARRRVRGAPLASDTDRIRQREIVDAFLAASRNGDFEALLTLLDPDAMLHADDVAVSMSAARKAQGAPELASEIHGAKAVARVFSGRAGAGRLVLVDGAAGLAWVPGGRLHVAFRFTIADGKIVAIDIIAHSERLRQLDLTVLDN